MEKSEAKVKVFKEREDIVVPIMENCETEKQT